MTSSSRDDSVSLLPQNAGHGHQNLVLLSLYRPPPYPHRRLLRLCAQYSAAFLLLAALSFLLFPSDPSLQLVRLKLNHAKVRLLPVLVLDLSISASVRVRNKNFFSLDYNYLGVSVGYRGKRLGFVSSDGGRVSARGSSYVNATVDLNGVEVIHDAFYLLQDLGKGIIPFDSKTEVEGFMGFFFIKFPIKARVSCDVFVNTKRQTIEHQDCYPEV
ncbi:uncharacterized protein LOC111793228 isoform X1 [Cucurbita pepo subsp. pepo]|uniref:uncharacterized protein LOC111793228 isoform X1 n=2 Tax=Cucurbita pepo subsp. pepo TaxID=3664 RepID=UPI000C9D65DD|nr:uncharacterized protein LOC111793228 isoform X1 [Cucurbita pepo subsp. pepo]